MRNPPSYTAALEKPMETISWDDEEFMEALLAVGKRFRPFSESMDAFLTEHGYKGSLKDTDAKVAFIRAAFERAGMTPPREVRAWYDSGQPVRRETVFQICFAFGLGISGTDDFFQRFYTRERSFDCHRIPEAVWYFCMKRGYAYADAQEILKEIPEPPEEGDAETVTTASIRAELDGLADREELLGYLTGNIGKFSVGKVTAYRAIRRMWAETAGPEGLLIRERRRFASQLDDPATGKEEPLPSGEAGVREWDALLGILQLPKDSVKTLHTDRSLKPVLAELHADVQDSFPDRQGIGLILRGGKVSYERVRKWLVLLAFYTFWAKRALKKGDYAKAPGDEKRCLASMDQHLMDAGYPALYVGNPYDWLFLYAAHDEEPLKVFRGIWLELLDRASE